MLVWSLVNDYFLTGTTALAFRLRLWKSFSGTVIQGGKGLRGEVWRVGGGWPCGAICCRWRCRNNVVRFATFWRSLQVKVSRIDIVWKKLMLLLLLLVLAAVVVLRQQVQAVVVVVVEAAARRRGLWRGRHSIVAVVVVWIRPLLDLEVEAGSGRGRRCPLNGVAESGGVVLWRLCPGKCRSPDEWVVKSRLVVPAW